MIYLMAFLPTIIIAVFNIILYYPTIYFSTSMDDTQHYDNIIKSATGVTDPKKAWWHQMQDRLYGAGTFAVNAKIDHQLTILLWSILCMLVYEAFGHNNISFAAAMLVSCHPLMNSLSVWLNGRRYLVCAILLMMSMISFSWWPAGAWSMLFYSLSAGMQMTIAFAPVLFLAKPFGWIGLAVIGIFIFKMRKWIAFKIKSRESGMYAEHMKKWTIRRPVVIVKVFGFYFFKMIIPQRVQMVYPFLQMFSRTKEGTDEAYSMWGARGINWDFAQGVVALCIVAAMFVFSPNCYRPYVVFLFLSLLQWCAVISVTQLVADRYAGIPCIFMCFFMAYFSLTYLPLTVSVGILCLIAGPFIYLTRQVFYMYRHFDAWYDYHAYDDFSNLAVIILKIGLLMARQKLCQAGALLEHALAYYPKDYALNFLGYVMCMITKNVPLARKHLDMCKANVYIGEEKIREGELADADLAIRAMSGEQVVVPPHMRGPGKK